MSAREPSQCLFCYDRLAEGELDFHARCSRKFFGTAAPPELPYTIDQVAELAGKTVLSRVTVTGAQPKLSLHLEKRKQLRARDVPSPSPRARLTIVGLWGGYNFKPPSAVYPELPEIEDLSMHLAEIAGIATVPHSLIRFQSGQLSYIARRIDRSTKPEMKIHMEDMCQLTNRLTEHKYHGSMEQIGRVVLSHSTNPGIDALNLFEVTLFSFLIGNADMHLKNFSLIESRQMDELSISLAPAYDLVATRLVIPSDKDQLALQMNGRKSNIGIRDFKEFASYLNLNEKARGASIDRIAASVPQMKVFVKRSFLTEGRKLALTELLAERMECLGLK